MGKHWESETKYFGMDSEALRMCEGLEDSERLAFFDRWRTDCFNLRSNNDEMPEYPKTMCGVLNTIAWKTAKYVFDTYMKRKNANVSGGKKSDATETIDSVVNDGALCVIGEPLGANVGQSNKYQSISNILTSIQINQIKHDLKKSGYTETEIDNALNSKTNKEISNPQKYIQTVIENERREKMKSQKTVSSQCYGQRDYHGEQEEALQRMIALAGKN